MPAHAAMTWAQRLKRVFGIDVQTCEHCGGALKIIAKILTHLGIDTDLSDSTIASARAPPSPILALFD